MEASQGGSNGRCVPIRWGCMGAFMLVEYADKYLCLVSGISCQISEQLVDNVSVAFAA